MDGLEQQYRPRLAVERVDFNSERGQALARRYQVRAHPAILVIDADGAATLAIPGIPDRARVVEAIEQVLE